MNNVLLEKLNYNIFLIKEDNIVLKSQLLFKKELKLLLSVIERISSSEMREAYKLIIKSLIDLIKDPSWLYNPKDPRFPSKNLTSLEFSKIVKTIQHNNTLAILIGKHFIKRGVQEYNMHRDTIAMKKKFNLHFNAYDMEGMISNLEFYNSVFQKLKAKAGITNSLNMVAGVFFEEDHLEEIFSIYAYYEPDDIPLPKEATIDGYSVLALLIREILSPWDDALWRIKPLPRITLDTIRKYLLNNKAKIVVLDYGKYEQSSIEVAKDLVKLGFKREEIVAIYNSSYHKTSYSRD